MTTIGDQPVQYLIDNGIANTEAEAKKIIVRMLEGDAIITHPMGNRCYGAFILDLDVDADHLEGLFLDAQGNDWCRACFDTGIVKVEDPELGQTTISCQECNNGVNNERQNDFSIGQAESGYRGWTVPQ